MIPLHAEANFRGDGARLFGIPGSFNALILVICTPLITALFKSKTNIKRIFYAGILYTLGFGLLGFVSVKSAFFLAVFIFTMGEIEILESISTMPYIINHTLPLTEAE